MWTNSTNSNSYLHLILTGLPTVPAKGHMGSDYKQSQPIVLSGNHQEQVLMNIKTQEWYSQAAKGIPCYTPPLSNRLLLFLKLKLYLYHYL